MQNPGGRVIRIIATLAVLLGVSLAVSAHGPSRQKVIESIDIDAPVDTVWPLIADFAQGWSKWHPAITSSVADNGNNVGSSRTLTLANGKTLVERLDALDAETHTLKYFAKAGGDALPVTNYSSTITVTSEGGKTHVEWRGAFYRGYPNGNPPPDQNDEAALAAVTNVYQTGLKNLKLVAEKH